MDSYNEQERKKAMLSAFKQTFRTMPKKSNIVEEQVDL